MREKKWIDSAFNTIFGGDADLRVMDELVNKAKRAVESGEWKEMYVHLEEDYEDFNLQIRGKRLETDEEFSERVLNEIKYEDAQKETRKRIYQELKKEFEG